MQQPDSMRSMPLAASRKLKGDNPFMSKNENAMRQFMFKEESKQE